MKREEKNKYTRQKIMNAALNEFGEKSYGEASLNTVCKEGEVSKGIIYHYFKDKDALFLACSAECFDALTKYLKEKVHVEEESIETVLERYFDARMEFFTQNPGYLKLYYSAAIMPPPHLKAEILEIRKGFDSLNREFLTGILKKVPLRDGLTIDGAAEVFGIFQDLVNTYEQTDAGRQTDVRECERRRSRILNVFLYGVIGGRGSRNE